MDGQWSSRVLGLVLAGCTVFGEGTIVWNSARWQQHRQGYRQRMDNIQDLQYYGNVTIGNQKIRAILDTGSIEFVIISDRCAYWCGDVEHLYHANGSKTYQRGNLSQVLTYGSGDLEVHEAYESIEIGPLSAAVVPFWETVDANMALLLNSDFQAIIGLGPTAPNTKLMRYQDPGNSQGYAALQKLLNIDRFSVCLMKEPGSHGYVTWNDNQLVHRRDMFTKLDIPDTGYWMLKLQDVRLGKKLIGCAESCGAVVDSGTSLLAVPQYGHDAMTQALSELKYDCADLSTLPELHFTLNGVRFALPADSYMGDIHGDVANTAAKHFKFVGMGNRRNTSNSCEAALMHITMDSELGDVWILGMPFFRKFYTVFAQISNDSPASIYTALADEHCFPTPQQPTQLMSGRGLQRARSINAAKVHVPPWVVRAHAQGRLERGVLSGLMKA